MATLILGAEHDRKVKRAATWALRKIGARRKRGWLGFAGSQEIAHTEWKIGRETLVLEAETFLGLTLSGPDEIVDRVESLCRQRLGR